MLQLMMIRYLWEASSSADGRYWGQKQQIQERIPTPPLCCTHGWLMSGRSFLMKHRVWSLSKHVILGTRLNTHRLPNEQKSLSFHYRHGTGNRARETLIPLWTSPQPISYRHCPWLQVGSSRMVSIPEDGLSCSLQATGPSPLPPISICYSPHSQESPGVWGRSSDSPRAHQAPPLKDKTGFKLVATSDSQASAQGMCQETDNIALNAHPPMDPPRQGLSQIHSLIIQFIQGFKIESQVLARY